MPIDVVPPGAFNALNTSLTPGSKDSPEKIQGAASQFEALLIGQMLKSAHDDDSGGWLGTGDDEASSSVMGMADEFFANAMAAQGGFGLAKIVTAGLQKSAEATRSSPESNSLPSEPPNTTSSEH